MVGFAVLRRRRRQDHALHPDRAPAERGPDRGRARDLGAGRAFRARLRAHARRRADRGGAGYECALPFELWRISVAGAGRAFARAEDLALAPDDYEEVELAGELRFTAWTKPVTFASGLTGAVASHHYEQPGSLSGVLEIDGDRVAIAGRGMRDHSWGVRDWQAVPYWRWFGIVVDPDNFLMLNNVGTADGGETAGGLVMRDGVAAEVASCETESELDPELGCQRRFVARATDVLGREAVLEGEALSVAPLRQRHDGRLTNINEALTRLRWDRHEGYGISEYLIQPNKV
jgi:hypothetical protein